jgi:glycosyltransferase involved in cell wall biosynthesis
LKTLPFGPPCQSEAAPPLLPSSTVTPPNSDLRSPASRCEAPASQCAAVIPCYNEAQTISSVISAARPHVTSIIVIDDGSPDETAALAESAGAIVLRHSTNQGKGAALRAGFQKARELNLHWAIALDGDGQHAPSEIPRFMERAQNTGALMVVGNRMTAERRKQMPWLRRLVNRYMSRRLSKLAGHPLPDSQCGFRLLNLDAWSALPINTTRFEIESELTLEFIRAGRSVEFVPISVIYKNEHSKIHPVRDTVRWFKWLRSAR